MATFASVHAPALRGWDVGSEPERIDNSELVVIEVCTAVEPIVAYARAYHVVTFLDRNMSLLHPSVFFFFLIGEFPSLKSCIPACSDRLQIYTGPFVVVVVYIYIYIYI